MRIDIAPGAPTNVIAFTTTKTEKING